VAIQLIPCCKRLRHALPGAAILLVALISPPGASSQSVVEPPEIAAREYTHRSGPEMLTYEELVALSEDTEFGPELAEKLRAITTTPFVSNEAYYRGARPRVPEIEGLGRSLRLMFWNAERGYYLDEMKLLFGDPEAFMALAEEAQEHPELHEHAQYLTPMEAEEDEIEELLSPEGLEDLDDASAPESVDLAALRASVELLQTVDVIVLNEVDWGMPRTDYREVIVELGEVLDMNWAYATEFVEIDPVVLGTETFQDVEDPALRAELLEAVDVDRERLHALHGTAILSRYPISAALARPFDFQPYDWYAAEKGLRPAERGLRAGLRVIGDEIGREMRRGGRTLLAVDLDVPYLAEGRLTVVSPHLENRTKPQNRPIQMAELLELVRQIPNPVIIAGDLNTLGGDAESLRLERLVYKKATDPSTWVTKGAHWATGVGAGYDIFRLGFKFTKNVSDPTVTSIPFFAPNKELGLFSLTENFRFADGGAFDFRGDVERTVNGLAGTLANSNQRADKGFANTYDYVITIAVIGKYKLDWVFVKSYLESPRDTDGSYKFAPHFARTMRNVNYALGHWLSDHSPMTVDLPFNEPADIASAGERKARLP